MKATNKKAFAEVIESSLHNWLAQSWRWDESPEFASLVTIQNNKRTLFGIVYQIKTGSLDPIRYPFPYQKTHQELKKEQPQIFEFLKTTFSCLLLGYKEVGKLFYILPPQPVLIHSFVELAAPDLQKEFFSNIAYLHLLFGLSQEICNLDELLLALLKHQQALNILTSQTLSTFIDTFSLLSGNDYRRLKLFLSRAQYLV